MTGRFLVTWRAGEPGKPATIGGFLRCDNQEEVDKFCAQLETAGASYHVSESE